MTFFKHRRVYMNMCIRVYMDTGIHGYTSAYMGIRVYTYTCIHEYMSAGVRVCMYTRTCVYMCTCIHVHVYTRIRMYVCTCIHDELSEHLDSTAVANCQTILTITPWACFSTLKC